MSEQMREQMRGLRGEMDRELAEVLTAEQMKKLQELREQMRQEFRQGGGRRGPPPSEG
jgi:Spy/CpxP family protein refolding chaperone